jgi:NAD+ kinase
MLRASRVCAPVDIPLLGLNMGYLGFLTEIKALDWQPHLDAVLSGDYWVEQRMMVHATAWNDGQCIADGDALNEFIIGRGTITRTIHLDVYIDGEWTTTYTADALIVATATGSTAYALASGGPILPPELRNILICPVAPHLSLDRPIVLPEGATVEVVVAQNTSAETVLTGDGDVMTPLKPGCSVRIQASRHVSRFVRLRERNYFYRSLLDRLEPRIPSPPTARHLPTDEPNLP